MVRIINYNGRVAEDGSIFFSLVVQGGIEMIRSKKSGRFYATARKVSIPTTFDENTCQALIGTDIPGAIQKQGCEPYDYTIKESGEVIQLSHRYVYVPEEDGSHSTERTKKEVKPDVNAFSSNGVLETA